MRRHLVDVPPDDGDPGASRDLTNPPAQCAAFLSVFNSRRETLIHEFSFLPTADGYSEQGHLNFTALRAASAANVDASVPGAHVIWRATIASHTANGASHTMHMDVVYLGAGDVLVKVRVARCACQPPVVGDGELQPGEIAALRTIAQGLAPKMSQG